MRDYRATLRKEALAETRDLVFANKIRTIICGSVIFSATGVAQYLSGAQTKAEMVSYFVAGGFGLAMTILAFAVVFLYFFLYEVPKRRLARALLKITEAESERNTAREELKAFKQSQANEADKTVQECFAKTVEAIKGDVGFTFNALWLASGHLLPSNDLVVRVCDRLVEQGYHHPFTGLKAYVLDSEYLAFLHYVKYHAENEDIIPGKGHTYLHAAERWRKRQGHPEPPNEDSLTMLFAKTLEIQPLPKRESKGLKVSVDEAKLKDVQNDPIKLSIATTRLIFLNDGPTKRTILVIEFLYAAPEKVWDGHYETFRAYRSDDSPFETLPVDSGSEVVLVLKSYFIPTELTEAATAQISVKIVSSDGKSGSSSKIIPLITIIDKDGYSPNTPKRLSLDE